MPVNLRLHPEEVSVILADSLPKLVVAGEEALHLSSALSSYTVVKAEEVEGENAPEWRKDFPRMTRLF